MWKLVMIAGLLCGGCIETSDECVNDFDCKGDRVCNDRVCEDPVPAGSGEEFISGGQVTRSYAATGALVAYGTKAFCTATLVASDRVLTAAHCVQNQSAGSMEFVLGADLQSSTLRSGVTTISIHPNWNGNFQLGNDLAVLTLATPITSVAPVNIVLSEGQSLDRLGQSAMYRAGAPAVCYQKTLNRFRATEAGPLPEYAQLYFRFCLHTGVFRAAGSITTNIAHLTQEKLRRIPFVLCPLEEQRVLVERARGALARLEDLQAGVSSVLARFASVEQAALAKAFRGELVDQDPNDEPAAALIERIRALVDTRTERGAAKPHGRVAHAKSHGRTALAETES